MAEEEAPQPIEYPLFQIQSQTPLGDLSNLQNTYGTAAMPVFNWVQSIQTGTGSYTPTDPADQALLEQYEQIVSQQGVPPGLPSPGEIAGDIVGQVGSLAAGQIGASMFDPYVIDSGQSAVSAGLGDTFGSTPLQMVDQATTKGFELLDAGKIKGTSAFQPELATRATAEATGNLDLFNKLPETTTPGVYDQSVLTKAAETGKANLFAEPITAQTATPTFMEKFGQRIDPTSAAGKANLARAGGSALLNFGIQLASGRDPAKAARSAGAQAIGTYLGNALLPGFGGIIGGVLGSALGGRVICNELMRQGIMSRKQVVLDYKFTRDFLTPMHVNGYHVWAVWMVRQMRKGRFVNFWKHVAGHRANEIAYIYGERDKPDYLGKIYRKILEPMCLVIGSFCNKTDWSTLYKQKEI
tara:strand:- start:7439 stop:8674 length:1236 start_codon:yes stop_codon:yes gene_type:complete